MSPAFPKPGACLLKEAEGWGLCTELQDQFITSQTGPRDKDKTRVEGAGLNTGKKG